MILIVFIIVIYVYLMYFLKSDINQFEHLITLLLFVGILIILSGHEANIILLQKHIDNYLGLSSLGKKNIYEPIFYSDNMKKSLTCIQHWIIQDYKSSQCRKWIKWINNKRAIIFSS
jgi:hypothetical protein